MNLSQFTMGLLSIALHFKTPIFHFFLIRLVLHCSEKVYLFFATEITGVVFCLNIDESVFFWMFLRIMVSLSEASAQYKFIIITLVLISS